MYQENAEISDYLNNLNFYALETKEYIIKKLRASLEEINSGKGVDGNEVLKKMREKYSYEV